MDFSKHGIKINDLEVSWLSIPVTAITIAGSVAAGKKAKTIPGKIFGIIGSLCAGEFGAYLMTRHNVKKELAGLGYDFKKYSFKDHFQIYVVEQDSTIRNFRNHGCID